MKKFLISILLYTSLTLFLFAFFAIIGSIISVSVITYFTSLLDFLFFKEIIYVIIIFFSFVLSGIFTIILGKILSKENQKKTHNISIFIFIFYLIPFFLDKKLSADTLFFNFSMISSSFMYWLVISYLNKFFIKNKSSNIKGPWEQSNGILNNNTESIVEEDVNIPNPRGKKLKRYKIVTMYSGWFKFNLLLILTLGVFYYPILKNIIFEKNLDLNLHYVFNDFSYNRIIYFYEFLENIYFIFNTKIFQLSNLNLILFSIVVLLSIVTLIYHLLKKQKFPKKVILKKSIIIILVAILTFLLFLFYNAYFKNNGTMLGKKLGEFVGYK